MYPHSCQVKRDVAVGTNGRHKKQLLSSSNRCLFIPMASRSEIENDYSIGSGYDVYFANPTADIKAGDQLLWKGDTYNIRAARSYAVPRVGYLHCLAVREGIK
jgi:hypothetical protein